MNLPIPDSKRDIAAIPHGLDERTWFAEGEQESVRRSSRPPHASAVIKIGEFLGDPEVDGWLR